MSTRSLSGLQRALLLGALVLGVIAMHQLVTTEGMPGAGHAAMSAAMSAQPGITSDHDEMPGGVVHDLMHLCMAVLCSLAVVVLLVARSRRPVTIPRSGSRCEARPPDRPPPIAGRLLLAQVCVLRR